jgi:hypothetical protein
MNKEVETKTLNLDLTYVDLNTVSLITTASLEAIIITRDSNAKLFAVLTAMIIATGRTQAHFDAITCQFDRGEIVIVVPPVVTHAA